MSSSVAAGLVLLIVALAVGIEMMDLPTPWTRVLQLVLIVVAGVVGSRIKKKSESDTKK